MTRSSPLLWFSLLMIVLLPTAAGRLLIDIAGGLMLFLFTLPIILGGIGWLGWRALKTKMVQCEVCGISTINSSGICPVCGSEIKQNTISNSEDLIPASEVTIDIKAENPNSDDQV